VCWQLICLRPCKKLLGHILLEGLTSLAAGQVVSAKQNECRFTAMCHLLHTTDKHSCLVAAVHSLP
jgi:hypothetical protein